MHPGALLALCFVCGLIDASSAAGSLLSENASGSPKYYFWNEVTGDTQWEDPGGVAYEDEEGANYFVSSDGSKADKDPEAHRYAWQEGWSEEHSRNFYFNQESKESVWERPADLAWRRVPSPKQEL